MNDPGMSQELSAAPEFLASPRTGQSVAPYETQFCELTQATEGL
eukprot:CAMPEP_0197392050 /NCGR_PEP_ID=MMETSP1165-20131217/3486_1 /TAXON_ID=284809 /ORGANISM="Chrysocystis fragilis, Strain CCMP3189" /LENGTH=43 /DNA_ID= /DNA_START= /DNA_END= /DNA_ORIENTATION=